MNDNKLRELVAEAVTLDREISVQAQRLKDLKAELVSEARSRACDTAPTEGGGAACVFEGGDGCIARVHLPGPTLKSKIEAEGAIIQKIKVASGRFFERLFRPALSYQLAENFRAEASTLLGRDAARLISLCQTESRPRVSFETKEVTAAEFTR